LSGFPGATAGSQANMLQTFPTFARVWFNFPAKGASFLSKRVIYTPKALKKRAGLGMMSFGAHLI
jgi:hypothetical protein